MIDTMILIIENLKIDSNKCEKLRWTDYPGWDTMKCKYKDCICNVIKGNRNIHGSSFNVKSELYYIRGLPKYNYLTFNIPKLLNPEHNLYPLNKEQAQRAFNKLFYALQHDGIELDLENSMLSRVDLFKNVYIKYQYDSYTPLFETLRASRLKKLPHDSSWYFQNTVREIIIYDKKLELKENQKVKYYDKEVMRIEYRLLGRRTCHNDFPFSTFGELLDDWDSLEDIFHEKVTKLIFQKANQYPVDKCDAKSDLDELIWFHKTFERKWFEKYLLANGAQNVMEKVGDTSIIHRELVNNSLSPAPTRQIDLLNKYLMLGNHKSQYGASVREMYDEIRSELLKPVADYLDESEMIP